MPNKYKRKAVAIRGNWSEESLKAAIIALKNAEMSVYAAAIFVNSGCMKIAQSSTICAPNVEKR